MTFSCHSQTLQKALLASKTSFIISGTQRPKVSKAPFLVLQTAGMVWESFLTHLTTTTNITILILWQWSTMEPKFTTIQKTVQLNNWPVVLEISGTNLFRSGPKLNFTKTPSLCYSTMECLITIKSTKCA